MVCEIEIEHDHAGRGVRTEIGALDRVQQIATAAIGLVAARGVFEWHEQAAGIAFDPEGAEAQRLIVDLEFEVADASERHFAGWRLRRLRFYGYEMREDSLRWVKWPVVEPGEIFPICCGDRALRMLLEQAVLLIAKPGQGGGIGWSLAQLSEELGDPPAPVEQLEVVRSRHDDVDRPSVAS